MNLSNLQISVGGLTPWSGANCEQTLSPINTGNLLRTVNGSLVYVANAAQQKYTSVITSSDKIPAAFDNLWRGQEVQISCITELWQKFVGNRCQLLRKYVPGSVHVSDENGRPLQFTLSPTGECECPEGTLDGFVGYRPILAMLVTEIVQETKEWDFVTKWCLKSEEV